MLDVNVWINLLVLDHNGDGRIQSGNELFGNGTDTASGKAVDGFAALAQHDLNGDSRMYMCLTYWQWKKDNGNKNERQRCRQLRSDWMDQFWHDHHSE